MFEWIKCFITAAVVALGALLGVSLLAIGIMGLMEIRPWFIPSCLILGLIIGLTIALHTREIKDV